MDNSQIIELALLAESAERHDDMAAFMEERVRTMVPLSEEERDMFNAAFKNALNERRNAVRVAAVIESQELADQRNEDAALANGYRAKVEAELSPICSTVLSLLSEILVPAAQAGEAKTFYKKMQGDYHRYMAEVAVGDMRSQVAQQASDAYAEGMAEAQTLPTTHPVRLGLALNLSVFQHEALQNTLAAITTARSALAGCEADLASIPEETRKDVMMTIRLFEDNLRLWEQEQVHA
jgi:hypothetical protein|eukprot:TRINITY_DN75690_c0_g1_i1.p1 TRINITY_DN75690_c0_g1~~TRINITY_DN75690_c0_g1_i1.p1  ORF type:complete len:237 (+),score=58.63 TRINITY_DN75690_c0_g1_i1:89-799(+)